MSECEHWLQEYVFLALRIDKFLKRKARNSFIGHFIGSPEWKAQVEEEPNMLITVPVQAASDLANALPRQQFEPQRLAYLQKQAVSMQTFCRKLSGEPISLEDEIKNCLDIEIAWIPETYFQEIWDWFDDMLPGQASFTTRLYSWRRQQRLQEKDTANFMEQIRDEIRNRTLSFVDLPPNEGVELQVVRSTPGSCWYLAHGLRNEFYLSSDLA